MKKIILALLMFGIVTSCSSQQIEGFVYIVSTPDEISKLSGLPSYLFSKPVNWQYPIGTFTTAEACKQAAEQRLSSVPYHLDHGWMCGKNCKTDPDLNIRICTVVIEG